MQYQVRPKENDAPIGLRAAQYLRVSTEQQKYSIENQAAAIAAYAARRNISIVRTYSDRRSGVRIVGRDGLKQLIQDVQRGHTNFNCILVYDVSRWGRFQDVDESGYYEFICRRAGINIHYCADEFENDGSFASIILKTNKRVAAADFSRQLSKKVFLGQCRVTTLGRWRGGPAPYGLRRMLIGENGKPKMQLKFGQRKSLKTEHVVLVRPPRPWGQTITTSSADKREHPPTETMNRVAGDKATSSQDAQRQQQGQPTTAQQAQGAQPSTKMSDPGC
jgi:DNA invertase Pin-like site-specific DNA recombinase